jgi:phosphonoacetaldehyde hydrolase
MNELAAVIFDWAGTMVDFGCMAPVRAFAAALANEGVVVAETDIRADMGLAKRDHVRALLAREAVGQAWLVAHGRDPDEADGDRLYKALEPLMMSAAGDLTTLIPGAAEVSAMLGERGVKIGSCTGYTRPMMGPILQGAAAQGYSPAVTVCAGETPAGRPSPLMMWRALIELEAWPAWRCVKVDDAPVGIEEGRAAGAWTVGLSASGNGMGLDLERWKALSYEESKPRLAASAQPLKAAGADYVIETVADLPAALKAIDYRISRGERPNL